MNVDRSQTDARLYIWLDGEPGMTPADVSIPDEAGLNDNDQIAEAIARGELGRYLPVTVQFADHPTPSTKRVRSLDIARLLRDRHIRHRRRYEIMSLTPDQRAASSDACDAN